MIEVVIVDILPIGFFLNRAWVLHFIGPTKPTINFSKFRIIIWIPPKKRSKNRSNCTSLHFTLQIFDDSINFFWGEREDISIGGENGEIPYDPIYLTSRTIYQPKMHLPLQDFERVLLEHQWALNGEKKKSYISLWYGNVRMALLC